MQIINGLFHSTNLIITFANNQAHKWLTIGHQKIIASEVPVPVFFQPQKAVIRLNMEQNIRIKPNKAYRCPQPAPTLK